MIGGGVGYEKEEKVDEGVMIVWLLGYKLGNLFKTIGF